jgi:hypothetical protein
MAVCMRSGTLAGGAQRGYTDNTASICPALGAPFCVLLLATLPGSLSVQAALRTLAKLGYDRPAKA